MSRNSKTSKTKNKNGVSRRDFLKKGASGAAALPFVLAISSKAFTVITDPDSLQPFRDREDAFRAKLEAKLGQGTMPRPQPHPPKEPPPRLTYNTEYETSIQTSGETSSRSGDPPKADDTDSDTYHDGSKADYKTDIR